MRIEPKSANALECAAEVFRGPLLLHQYPSAIWSILLAPRININWHAVWGASKLASIPNRTDRSFARFEGCALDELCVACSEAV
jgi:hypothetical protein